MYIDDMGLHDGLVSRLKEAASVMRENEGFIHVVSHYDGDGMGAGAVLARALYREGRTFQVEIRKGLGRDSIAEILLEDHQASVFIFADMGSGFLDEFSNISEQAGELGHRPVIILDHHIVRGNAGPGILNVNGRDWGYDGGREVCGSTTAMLFALALDDANADLLPVAMAGAYGDKQSSDGWVGINRALVELGNKTANLREDRGPHLFGDTLLYALHMSNDPYLRGISGYPDAAGEVLEKLGIDPDLSLDELRNTSGGERALGILNSFILTHLLGNGVRPEIAACTSCVGCAVRGCHGGYHAPPTLPPPSAAAPVDADESAAIWARAESLAARVSDDPLARGATLSPDPLVQPWPGIPIALGIVGLMFGLVIGLGMGLRRFLILPFFRGWVFPVIEAAVTAVVGPLWLRNILIGEYGFLIKGLDWPFALVLPYVISFYLGLSILEDWGYLPRLGVLLDGLYKKIGLNGACTIPLLLGYGCGIPAIMSTRSLPTRKQRVMVSAMVCFAVPCVSQTGAFISLLAERSIGAVALLFLLSIAAIVTLGALIDKLNPEAAPYTILEMPELLAPKPRILAKKVWMRVRHYIFDGAVPMIVAVLIAALLYELGILEILGEVFAPLISGWLRLPNEAVVPLILGIVRRELAVLPLIDMELTTLQFITSAVIALFYVPCIAMVATMAKEFGLKVAAATLAFTTFAALFFGGLLAQLGALLPFV